MKPKPLSSLNHLTVPVAIASPEELHAGHAGGFHRAGCPICREKVNSTKGVRCKWHSSSNAPTRQLAALQTSGRPAAGGAAPSADQLRGGGGDLVRIALGRNPRQAQRIGG